MILISSQHQTGIRLTRILIRQDRLKKIFYDTDLQKDNQVS